MIITVNLCQFDNQLTVHNQTMTESRSSISSQEQETSHLLEERYPNLINRSQELSYESLSWDMQSSIQSQEKINTKQPCNQTKSHIVGSIPPLQTNTQFYIEEEKQLYQSQYYHDLSTKLLEQIQLLNYEGNVQNLEAHFKKIANQHIKFDDILPVACSSIGSLLIQNGLFHGMWGMILKNKGQEECFYSYYNAMYQKLKVNHTNFQNIFNSASFSNDIQPFIVDDEQSNTRLTKNNQKLKMKSSEQYLDCAQDNQNSFYKSKININEQNQKISLNQSLTSPKYLQSTREIQILQQDTYGCGKRVRLLKLPQSNLRRIKMEQACYFFSIDKVYPLQQIQIDRVLQFQTGSQAQFAVLQAHMASYSEQLKKVVIDIRPKTLLMLSNFTNLSQLLRLKLTYNAFDGFVYYEELLDLGKWLKSNELLEFGVVSRK